MIRLIPHKNNNAYAYLSPGQRYNWSNKDEEEMKKKVINNPRFSLINPWRNYKMNREADLRFELERAKKALDEYLDENHPKIGEMWTTVDSHKAGRVLIISDPDSDGDYQVLEKRSPTRWDFGYYGKHELIEKVISHEHYSNILDKLEKELS